LEALKISAKELLDENEAIQLLNAGDNYGNTIFHLTVSLKRLEVSMYCIFLLQHSTLALHMNYVSTRIYDEIQQNKDYDIAKSYISYLPEDITFVLLL